MANENQKIAAAQKQIAEQKTALEVAEQKITEQATALETAQKQIDEQNEASIVAAKTVADLNKTIESMKDKPVANIKGFNMEVDDPFGKSVITVYRKAGGKSVQRDMLPFVLPTGEKASAVALESYIVRANGGGDKERAAAALQFKFKKRKAL